MVNWKEGEDCVLQEGDYLAEGSLTLQEVCAKVFQRCLVGLKGSTCSTMKPQ